MSNIGNRPLDSLSLFNRVQVAPSPFDYNLRGEESAIPASCNCPDEW